MAELETVADFNCCSSTREMACPLEAAKAVAQFATFHGWSGFPIEAAADGRSRHSPDKAIVEFLIETYDTEEAYGYSYGFSKHPRTDSREALQAMKGRFLVRPNGANNVTLTWSWTFDVTAGLGMAKELLNKAAAHVEI
jgi:hypothetical protein